MVGWSNYMPASRQLNLENILHLSRRFRLNKIYGLNEKQITIALKTKQNTRGLRVHATRLEKTYFKEL